jgi:hypothetical protein
VIRLYYDVETPPREAVVAYLEQHGWKIIRVWREHDAYTPGGNPSETMPEICLARGKYYDKPGTVQIQEAIETLARWHGSTTIRVMDEISRSMEMEDGQDNVNRVG